MKVNLKSVLPLKVPVSPENTVMIHAANTDAILDLDLNETLIAPVSSPRVLNFPVVGVALRIRPCRTFFSPFCAAYPPALDLAIFDCLRTSAIVVAHDHHGVVDPITIDLL